MKIADIIKGWFDVNVQYWNELRDQKKINDQNKVSPLDLYDQVHSNSSPVFVLSTGRCGTKLLTELLERSNQTVVSHSPSPEPTWHANWAYHNTETNLSNVKAAIDAMRYENIRDAYLTDKIYVETNNRITFFAPALAELYPKSKFIHLYRHPEKFVASGLGRNWYNGVITDEGRLLPSEPEAIGWPGMKNVEKIGWLWNETNRFIENFTLNLSQERLLAIKSEDFFEMESISHKILDFCKVKHIDYRLIKKTIIKPKNAQPKNKEYSLNDSDIKKMKLYTHLTNKYY